MDDTYAAVEATTAKFYMDMDMNTDIAGDALYEAAIAGDADAIAKLEMQADILNEHDDATILHVESERGNTERVGFILREFENRNLLVKLNRYKQTALHLAAYFRRTELAKVLIDAARQYLPYAKDNPISLKTVLQAAVRKGDVALVELLLKAAPTNIHDPNTQGIQVVEILIDAARLFSSSVNDNPITSFQAFLRKGDEDLNTALHITVMQGDLATAKLLIEADPSYRHTQNNEGETPMFIAAENGYYEMVNLICTTCKAPVNLDGPGGTTALHAAIKNLDKDKKEDISLIQIIISAAKFVNFPEDTDNYVINVKRFDQLFKRTDEDRCTVLELAVERNYVDVVELILEQNPAYYGGIQDTGRDLFALLPLIYKARDKEYRDVVNLLTQTFQISSALSVCKGDMCRLIYAIENHETETVLWLLDSEDAKLLVTFVDDLGWTALHHAVYHEFNLIINSIVEAQKKFGHQFVYQDKVSTPFHVAAEKGFSSTIKFLMQSWPSSSSAYTAVNKDGQNILHLAALQSKKEMVQDMLMHCREEYRNEFVNKEDNNGDTPLHLLIRRGCLVPEFLKYQGLETRVENKKKWTPPDMLYFEDQIIDDQVQIKIALDYIQIDQKRDIFSSSVLSTSKREKKDAILYKKAQQMTDEKLARMKEGSRAVANCFADAITGDPISRAALEMEANTLNQAGETILHIESKKGVIENVRFIVSAFADKNLLVKLDNQKQTALYLATHYGHTQVVEALIDASIHSPSSLANDDTQNPVRIFQNIIRQTNISNGNTALHLAVLNGNGAIVKLLVEADPNDSHVENNEGRTPIFIAAEKGYKDIVEAICTTCTTLTLDGPGGRTTALHALIQNISPVTEGASDMIRMIVHAARRWSSTQDPTLVNFEALFSTTDESGRTVLELAVEKNCVDAVRLILEEDPACQHGREIKRNGLRHLIYKAIDNKCSDDIVKLLSQTYKVGMNPCHEDVLALILAIKSLDEDSVLSFLENSKHLVTFADDNGWTPLHYAAFHEFDSILSAIIEAQEEVGHQFEYGNMVSTPFDVAVKYGYTSTLLQLMELWPASTSASVIANSPYSAVDKDGRNILHLAAANSNKEMVDGILKYCPEMYKDKILKQQDINGDTPLHLLISHGCFIPELIKHKGLDTMTKNKNNFTPRDMLYVKDDIVGDQVHIKIALDRVQTNQSVWKPWAKRIEKKTDIWKSNKVSQSKQKRKDGKFEKGKKLLMDAKHEQMKKDLERYKMRTNTQIIVTALITTVTFTVGFTMPGGLYQSGDFNEGLVVLSRKKVFNAFMVSDAIALLLSTSSLFFYFLESMNEDPRQVSKLNAASTVLNIVSVMAMMLTFITGTYVVLSHSPALSITVSVIGSLFFLLIIVLSIKILYERKVKRNED